MVSFKDDDEKSIEEGTQITRVAAGMREEEVCQILSLKRNLDYSDVLITYAGKYLRMGWDLVAINFKGEAALDLDFRESREVWANKLTGLGSEGIQVNLGVRTGAPSRLIVLEVHREESFAPFNQRGDWCSGCVAEVGLEREQHYYVLPKGWQPPSSFFMESCQIMVFGEGGMVLTPPSLEPQAQSNLRWLRPPWESPPTRPSSGLCKFLKEHAPVLSQTPVKPQPVVISWAEIYPAVSAHPEVLQALLAPAATSEGYYQNLLKAARAAGLEDASFLLGLLWHAPLGNSRSHPQREEYLADLIKRGLTGVDEGESGWGAMAAEINQGYDFQDREPGFEEKGAAQPQSQPGRMSEPAHLMSPACSSPPSFSPGRGGDAKKSPGNGDVSRQIGVGEFYEAWSEMCQFSRDSLIVERRRYEAMIYELGKLGALHDFFKKEHRQNKALRGKLEAQWAKELDYLRQVVSKKSKKGWYRLWQED